MNRRVAVGLALLALPVLFWIGARIPGPRSSESVDAPAAVVPLASVGERAPPVLISRARMAPASESTSKNPYAAPPEGNRIEFEVVGSYAIAWGDVMLGKVDGDLPRGRGVYDAPVPRAWEGPEIAYAISPQLPDPGRVERAIAYFNEHTVVRFVPIQNQKDALVFEAGDEHCYSALGKTGGLQPIKLARECGTPEILHEILHALGFIHEHSRVDRDQSIQVHWDQIESKYLAQFAIAPDALMEPLRDTPFDFQSIMLYRPDTFARSKGALTLTPLNAGFPAIAPGDELSPGDIARVRRLFRL